MTSTIQTHLKNTIRIVMMETSHPGNIGAAARAMKNMGHSQLYLVNPKRFPHSEATARSAGADDLLAKAIVTPSLKEALNRCHLVFGCSARHRHLSWPLLDAKQCANQVIKALQQDHQVAILFGNEQAGLNNEAFRYCHFQVKIPTNLDYASLNLAAAIQILVYEIYCAAQQISPGTFNRSHTRQPKTLATVETLQAFYQHLETVLWKIQFLNPAHPKRLIQRLHRLFNRARLEVLEVNILRGILSAIETANQDGESSNYRDLSNFKE